MMTMMLRPTLLLLLVAGAACVAEDPPIEGSSGTTTAASSSTGSTVSATSTTGQPPATTGQPPTTGGTLEITTGDASESGSEFIVRPDGGCFFTGEHEVRCVLECQVGVQDCPAGEKCVPWANDGGDSWNSLRCSPVPEDPAGLGEACVAENSPVSGLDDCDVGALCFGVDPRTLAGTCTALCDPEVFDPPQCGADEVCAANDDFQPYVCLGRCDPLDPATCAPDETCRDIGEDVVCVPTITLPQGLECGGAEQYCAVDEACMWADLLASCADSQCCRPWCDLTAPDPDLPCTAVPGEVCRPFFDAAPAGYEHVGACGLPA